MSGNRNLKKCDAIEPLLCQHLREPWIWPRKRLINNNQIVGSLNLYEIQKNPIYGAAYLFRGLLSTWRKNIT